MGWCNASNCTLSTKKVKMRLFRFPRNEDRRSKWLINCLLEIQYDKNDFPNSLDQQILKRYITLRVNIYVQK